MASQQASSATLAGYIGTFLGTLCFARIVIDSVNGRGFLAVSSWLTPRTWIGALGFALIACYAYWYRTRD